MQREKRKNPQFLISVAGAVVLALIALTAASTVFSTLQLTDEQVVLGPGFFPFALSVLLFLCCVLVIYTLLSRHSENVITKAVFNGEAFKRPVMLLALAAAAVAGIPLLGFLGSMFLFSFAELTYLEKQKQPLLLRFLYSAVIVGGLYWLFTALMKSPLPAPFWL
jgi:hypothetical protein